MVRTQSFTPSKHRPIGNGANQSKKVRRNTIGRSVPDRTVAILELPGRDALVDDRLLLHLQWRSGRCQGTLITDTRRRPDRSVRNARTTPSTSCHGDLSRRYDRCYVFAEPLDHEGEVPRSGIIRSKLGNKRELQLFGRDACSPRPGNLCRHICCEHRNSHRRRWHDHRCGLRRRSRQPLPPQRRCRRSPSRSCCFRGSRRRHGSRPTARLQPTKSSMPLVGTTTPSRAAK